MIYDEIVNEYGFDPEAPAPEILTWEPWTMRGAMECVTGRSDITDWTRGNSQFLQKLLLAGEEAVPIPGEFVEVTVELPKITDETIRLPKVSHGEG